jgi:hypothetical protein
LIGHGGLPPLLGQAIGIDSRLDAVERALDLTLSRPGGDKCSNSC